MGWIEFSAALMVFFLSHAALVRPPIKPWIVARLGSRGFTWSYSVLSVAILAWLILAAGRAPFVSLWYWQPWHNHVVLAIMLGVCSILALAIGRPNPFSFGGANNDAFDPCEPGIVAWMRHPLLVALALWALSHIFANGDLAHLIMFGSFAVFALLGGRIIDRRKKRLMGAEWNELRNIIGQKRKAGLFTTLLAEPVRLSMGVIGYTSLIALHPYLFGVSPLPG